jgi:hypothetical protein
MSAVASSRISRLAAVPFAVLVVSTPAPSAPAVDMFNATAPSHAPHSERVTVKGGSKS